MKTFRQEFQKHKFNFKHDKPEDFAAWAWQVDRTRVSGYFILYRTFWALFYLSVLVANGSTQEDPEYYFIYLTHLGYIIQTLHLVISVALPIEFLLQQTNGNATTNGLRWTLLDRFAWFLYNVTNLLSLAISVIYWGALFSAGSGLTAMNFFVHGLNSITSIIDILVCGRPCRLMHFYHPFVVILAYVAFSSIYWAAGGVDANGNTYIYPVLDWNNLKFTAPFVSIGLFIILPIVHGLLWALHQFRDKVLIKRIIRKKSSSSSEGNPNPAFELTLV